jgi:cyclic beta-1,2-glucan synthetase
MAQYELQRYLPEAPDSLCNILDGKRGVVEQPIRSEIFGLHRFMQHGRSLALTHDAAFTNARSTVFFPRLNSNILVLEEAQRYIGEQASTGYDMSPAAEWLLDNFHVIQAQLKEIYEGLPRSYFRGLPVLLDEPLAGLPRVYGVAWAFVAHTDGAFDEELLCHFLTAYQENRELNLSEMWALPTTLRVVLIENLRRLAERVATNKAAREVANLCCDHIEDFTLSALDQLLAQLNQRGVGRMFLSQMALRLQNSQTNESTSYNAWIQSQLPDLATIQMQRPADQAADNLSMRNAITALRAIGDADWTDIVSRTSALMRMMLTSAVFEAEDTATRDQSLHGIEQLAKRSGQTELAVAHALLNIIRESAQGAEAAQEASYWLRGAGRPGFMLALGMQVREAFLWRLAQRYLPVPGYLISLSLGTFALVAWIQWGHNAGQSGNAAPIWLTLIGVVVMAFPASEAFLAVINRLISESVRPRHLPRLALVNGIPPEHRVMVVIPAMLSNASAIQDLAHRLQLHYLANPERQAQFAMLTDWVDADTQTLASDDELLRLACGLVSQLNVRYPRLKGEQEGEAPRFIVLHRQRDFSETEQRWIGWERKRGKLELLVATLALGDNKGFIDLGSLSRIENDIKYILTLDSDTQLPPGRLRDLVGVAAHPHNQPVIDSDKHTIISGYGILQPRVATPLPAPKQFTLYHWLFAGQCGIDPYSAASSEVYQDMFREGTFTGKGLLNVRAMQAVLSGRLPDGQVLSHDLLEGSLARCAAVTDISVIEDAPFHADVAAARVHRWTRGDWQLLPFLFSPGRYPLRAINRWKMLDNLRRSLVAPMSLLLVLLALLGAVLSPWAALGLVVAAFSAGPFMGAVAGFSPSRDDLARLFFYRQAAGDLLRALIGGLWHIVQLMQQTLLALDAIGRALYRTYISRRYLLQWTTAATVQAAAKTKFPELLRQHWKEPVLALALLLCLLAVDTPFPTTSTVLCLIWGASPLWTWWGSRSRPKFQNTALADKDRSYLEGIGRDTWRLFERCVVADDNYLPPDNLQTAPHDIVAHRTSPTNMGLYLLSVACARQFGWIGTQELIQRLQATLGTMSKLERYRGHFLNWYDTQSLAPLLQKYVSTVDSGNLSGHLLAVAEACLELSHTPYDSSAAIRALETSKQRIALLNAPKLGHETAPSETALEQLLAITDPMSQCHDNALHFESLLQAASNELGLLPKTAPSHADLSDLPDHKKLTQPTLEEELHWHLVDHLATLRSVWLDVQAAKKDPISGDEDVEKLLQTLAHDLKKMAWQADFSFLYHRKRRLLHIGFRVEEQQLDGSFYDLLASESRLTSLLAIAKGDVPVNHWAALGRPFYAVGAHAGLRSWSGSMFEYLMPSLVLDEPPGSVLHDACCAALREQIEFASDHNVPWGMSESAYAASDETLAYQYAPQGVPRLALRRTPPGELVVAPYATALAAQIAPHLAVLNFASFQAIAARARFGFIEALDYSAARQTTTESFTVVDTFMAHHQGMSIVAIANVLLDCTPRRWGMANAYIEAVSSLLHERVPREVSILHEPPAASPSQQLQKKALGLLRDVRPGAAAIEPTHVLSNGRYAVTLRANGAGNSSWGQTNITRWRDDALRDVYGSFFYLRWDRSSVLVASTPGSAPAAPFSITQHPAPDPAAHYSSIFHADRVCFDAHWSELQTHTTVWVSPEDDIEFRRVELRNMSDRTVDIELMSAFEVTLADPLADEAHPAFSNLFLRAQWLAEQQALMFERRPRLATERRLYAAHFVAVTDPQVVGLRIQTDRQHWLGRNHVAAQPMARFDDVSSDTGNGILDTGLDPVCALVARLRIAPFAKARLTFATAAADNEGTLRAVIDKYLQHTHVQRASLMSATLANIRLRSLGISAEKFAAIQTLTTALVLSLTRPQTRDTFPASAVGEVCDKKLLWRFGISADRPILLVSSGAVQGLGMLRTLVQALRLWSWGGIACDVVVINAEPNSYEMPLHREMAALRERYVADCGGKSDSTTANLHVLRANELSTAELSTLQMLARVRLNADGRPFVHHVQEWIELHEQSFSQRYLTSISIVPLVNRASAAVPTSSGSFDDTLNEFKFNVSAQLRPTKPWVNVMANPAFGALISESGGGYTWGGNSRLNQLTAWSNDPVADPPAEWFLLQDIKTQDIWSVAPSAYGDGDVTYSVSHGQGYSEISHQRGDINITATWCVDAQTSVKQVHIKIVNNSSRLVHLRLVGIAEWKMGANRVDRSTTSTAMFRQRLPDLKEGHAVANDALEQKLTALLCTQRDHSAGFGNGTAFLALASAKSDTDDWTCDRRECFDARGRLVLPDHFGQRSGNALDPCAALAARIDLKAGESAQRVFLLGYAENISAAQQLATVAATQSAEQRLKRVHQQWDQLLGATQVATPDPLFDAMVNRWLLYQAVSCRLWAKAGFYQAGGAYGFRDQLQDAMALTWSAPHMLKQQIVLAASRQFSEGDVQHWWHAPGGAGVRTHFSDDLLWLPHACVRYLRATGDTTLLEQSVAFIEGAAIPDGAEDAYYTPSISTQEASVYEHAALAIDHSLKVGVHGLPLMGTGDWNDGMNRVGHEGRGESVWLAWFLCQLVESFAPLARERGDEQRALNWESAATGWKTALDGSAWDGQWFKRAFFDDGSALGSHLNPEAHIDLIAQAWSVLSGAASPALQRMALEAIEENLIDHDAGLIKLLDPPLVHASPSAGYIQAYPPGVRENGGQYSHGAVWALMAQAEFAKSLSDHGEQEEHGKHSDLAYQYFTYLSPAHRANHPTRGPAYGIEPYVMSGDVYTQAPYVGRGGWSWYTGAAAWMHRAAVESIFGLQLGPEYLSFNPCLPSHWPQAELRLTRDGRTMRFILCRSTPADALKETAQWHAQLLNKRQQLQWTKLAPDTCFAIPLLDD